MQTITAVIYDKDLQDFIRNFPKVPSRMYKDVYKLGRAGLQYVKTIIPRSSLRKPHLRDSFKINIEYVQGYHEGMLLSLDTYVSYAPFVNATVNVPFRRPKNKLAMRFIGSGGEVVFTKTAKGFTKQGINFVKKGEDWFVSNASRYIDLTLHKYVK